MIRKIDKMIKLIIIIFFSILFLSFNNALAFSDVFPQSTPSPTVADFLPSPNHTYYCSPNGNNTTGDGSIENPWVDLIGAQDHVAAGDLIYFRGGTYPSYSRANHSYSQNRLVTNGSVDFPIVITNYPGEIAQWNSTDTIWSITLQENYQKLIGTKVGDEYGIKINGGASVNGDYCQVSGVEFSSGTANGDINVADNPAMLSVPLNDGVLDLKISHNMFRDAVFATTPHRMCCIKLFQTTNLIIEYNTFQNNTEIYDGAISYKGDTLNSTIRYNKFHNCRAAIQYVAQTDDGGIDGISISNNLFHNMTQATLWFSNESGGNIRIFNNVSLGSPAFYYYLNYDAVEWNPSDHGQIYDNVIDHLAWTAGWDVPSAAETQNLPEYFNYNLWDSIADHNTLPAWGDQGWYENAVVSTNLGISYDSNTITAVADDNYPGLSAGRYGGNIGGFEFLEGDIISPSAPSGLNAL